MWFLSSEAGGVKSFSPENNYGLLQCTLIDRFHSIPLLIVC